MHQAHPNRESLWPLTVGLLLATAILGIIIKSSLRNNVAIPVGQTGPGAPPQAATSTQTLDVFYLKQTIEAGWAQEYQARLKTPSLPPGTMKPEPVIEAGPSSTPYFPNTKPLGAGTLFWGDPGPFPAMAYSMRNGWMETVSDEKVVIYVGALRDDPGVTQDASQGVVLVLIGSAVETYKTPSLDGPVYIIDAQGERLVLKAENSKLFYFDVPSRQFVNSLNAPNPPTIAPLHSDLSSDSSAGLVLASTPPPSSAYP